jgi:hypothetical protein
MPDRESSDMTILLTDDEVVAIAVHRGRQWPTILTSVDSSSTQDMAFAMVRGTRSLVVRRLARDESSAIRLSERLTELIEPFLGDPVLHVYPAPMGSPGRVAGAVVYVYAHNSAGDYPIEVVYGYGLHELSTVDEVRLHALLARLIGSAFDRDAALPASIAPSGAESDARALYLCTIPGPGREAVEISRGQVAWGAYAQEGASEQGFVRARISASVGSDLPSSLLPVSAP